MRKKLFKRRSPHPIKRALVGLIGGAAGTYAMSLYFKGVKALTQEDPMTAKKPSSDPDSKSDISVIGKQHKPGEDSTSAVGRILYEKATDNKISKPEKEAMSQAVHWTYGLTTGALYPLAKNVLKLGEVPASLAYGTGMWLFGSELAVPALGLSKGPRAFPVRHHVHSWIAHCIYGLTEGCVQKMLYRFSR